MKKKKIVALLLATSVMATSPALLANPMMVFAEDSEETNLELAAETGEEQIEVNTENIATNTSTIVINEGTVETNSEEGTITANKGSITYNNGSVTTNEGTGMYEDILQDTNLNVNEATGNGIKFNTGDVTTNEGDILNNQGTIETNNGNLLVNDTNGTIETNNGEIHMNHGAVTDNNGTIGCIESLGTVTTNNGEINNNFGTITENNGFVDANSQNATIEKNNSSITENYGTVKENAKIEKEDGITNAGINNNIGTVEVNNGEIYQNKGTVITNDSIVVLNFGTIEDNNRFVGTNHEGATVIIEDTADDDGRVRENRGTVEIIINEDKTEDEIDALAKYKAEKNSGEVIIKNTEDEVLTKYYGISGYNGLTGDDYFMAYLDSVRENNTYTLSIPSGYGVDGTITLSKDNTNLEVIGNALETNEAGDYIVPVGTQFKVTGCLEFIGKWYKILQSSGAIVEVVQDTSSNHDSSDNTPTQVTPVVKDFTTSIAGVEINSWEDVSNVMNTKADTITPELNSDFKLFKLELSKKQLTIPTSVVSNIATSQVDGLHCFIGDGNAITFVDNGTLGNYIPTDFTHSHTETNTMKTITFEKPQEIGATVIFSTRVPAKNTPVAIWMLVDGKYELIGFDYSNEKGNIAFPITSTGQFVLTY